VRGAAVKHVDEMSWQLAGKLCWLWVREERIGRGTMGMPEDEVHLWYAGMEQLDGATAVTCRHLLSPDELARWKRFHFERDRDEFLVAHALLRLVLSTYALTSPGEWRFAAGPHGKPAVDPSAGQPLLPFSLSHTRRLAAVAVTAGADVGADVEWLGRPVGPDLAEWALAEAEQRQLREAPPELRGRTFFSLWTLKEAYLKACGLGLSLPLKDFAFTLGPGLSARVQFTRRVADVASRWLFWQDQSLPDHCAAVAVRRPDGAGRPPSLVVYQADLARPGAVGRRELRRCSE
jgi:4'-phosphopantetheinyl transferase